MLQVMWSMRGQRLDVNSSTLTRHVLALQSDRALGAFCFVPSLHTSRESFSLASQLSKQYPINPLDLIILGKVGM